MGHFIILSTEYNIYLSGKVSKASKFVAKELFPFLFSLYILCMCSVGYGLSTFVDILGIFVGVDFRMSI